MTQELRKLAEAAKGWLIQPVIVQETSDDILKLGSTSEDGEFYELIEIDCENYDQPSRPLAEFIAAANPAAVLALLDERDQLQFKLGDAIQSSAHWQHQFTEAQAENDLLKGYRDRALELATAYNNAQENIEQINAHREHILAVNEKLAAQVDAMGKGEPVAWQFRTNGKHWHVVQVCPPDDVYDEGTLSPLYAAPKALAPLTDDELWKFWWSRPEVPEGEDESMEAQFVAAARSILAAHGITKGTP